MKARLGLWIYHRSLDWPRWLQGIGCAVGFRLYVGRWPARNVPNGWRAP